MDEVRVREAVFVGCPAVRLRDEFMDEVLEMGLNIELGLDEGALDELSSREFAGISSLMHGYGLRLNVHAPFREVWLGASDAVVRRRSVERLLRALDVAALVEAEVMVFHSGFCPLETEGERAERAWLGRFLESVAELAVRAGELGVGMALENVYERSPDFFCSMIRKARGITGGGRLGVCFDTGHLLAFNKGGIEEWGKPLVPFLFELHLHDNDGSSDAHLPPGEGRFDFDAFFSMLFEEGEGLAPPLLTLEPHSRDSVAPSLQALALLLGRHEGLGERWLGEGRRSQRSTARVSSSDSSPQ